MLLNLLIHKQHLRSIYFFELLLCVECGCKHAYDPPPLHPYPSSSIAPTFARFRESACTNIFATCATCGICSLSLPLSLSL